MEQQPTTSKRSLSTSSPSQSITIPMWLCPILNDAIYEVSRTELRILDSFTRSVVWRTCKKLDVSKRGVPGAACRLLERFLYVTLTGGSIAHTQLHARLQTNLFKYICACITIASKMTYSTASPSNLEVQKFLLAKKLYYSLPEICNAESEVYENLNFYVPMRTTIETGEMLANEVGMPEYKLTVVASKIDKAERKLDLINEKARHLSDLGPGKTLVVISLHLAAAVVAMVAKKTRGLDTHTVIHNLAALTACTYKYINDLSDIISDVLSPS